MKKWIFTGLAVVVVLAASLLTLKKVSPVSWGLWGNYNTSSELAIQGYDPVAYFASGQPAAGQSQHSYDWEGVTWQFASAGNRDLFAADPQAYAPQFGGFCAFAVSKGFTANVSPDAWHIEDGKLYLFADKNLRDDWVASLGEGSLERSTEHWAKR